MIGQGAVRSRQTPLVSHRLIIQSTPEEMTERYFYNQRNASFSLREFGAGEAYIDG